MTAIYIPDETGLRAYATIKSLITGEATNLIIRPGEFDSWTEIVTAINESYQSGLKNGDIGKAKKYAMNTLVVLQEAYPNLTVLMGSKEQKILQEKDIEALFNEQAPPLPSIPREWEEEYQAPSLEGLGSDACPWLDDYVAFSEDISKRGYKSFHPGCGLWLLSVIAMRRVMIPILDGKYTSLFIALASDSAAYSKTTTARIALRTLQAIGLNHILLQGSMTPEMYLTLQSGRIDEKYDEQSAEARTQEDLRLMYAGRLSLWWEEGGSKIAKIMHSNSPYAGWLDILRQLADCPAELSHRTKSSGLYRVVAPYGATLTNMTPEDIRSIPRGAGNPWSSGFFPRFIFLTPSENEWKLGKKTELGTHTIPEHISKPLLEWHKRLGEVKNFQIIAREGKRGGYELHRKLPDEHVCSFGIGAFEAYTKYEAQIRILANTPGVIPKDLVPWYIRLPEKMLQVAALMASLSNHEHIELRHVARAFSIAEEWRNAVHNFYIQIHNGGSSETKEEENTVVRSVSKLNTLGIWPTPSRVSASIANMGATRAKIVLDGLVAAGVLISVTWKGGKGKTLDVTGYGLPDTDFPSEYVHYIAEKDTHKSALNGHSKQKISTLTS